MSILVRRRPALALWGAGAGILFVIGVAVFLLSGYRVFAVTTPSMGTTLPVGSLVVVHPQPAYDVGEIATFRVDNRVYTHRIIAETPQRLTTKGDLNGAVDGWRVPTDDVVGSVVWSSRGLGWFARALPWLLIGGLMVEVLARSRRGDAVWKQSVRLGGGSLVVAAISLWLRPWTNMQMLGYRPADSRDGVLMHVVNTGLFPMSAGDQRLSSGQDAVTQVTTTNASGHYVINPLPALEWWQQALVIVVCLVPLLAALVIRPAVAGVAPEGDDDGQDSRTRRRGVILLAVIAALTALAVALVNSLSTHGAFAATVQNSTDTSGTRTFFTCKQAESSLGSASTYGAYALAAGAARSESDFSGSGRTATYLITPTTTSSTGCARDTPAVSASFAGNQCLSIPGLNAGPNTFSLEAWFRTTSTSNGKIIGFGTATNSSADANNDRHLYLDSTGRIVFGVYPNAVRTLSTAAGKSYADGAWHHTVAVLSSAGMRLYVDGALVGSNTAVTNGEAYNGYWKVGCGTLLGWANGDGTGYNGPSFFTGSIQYAAVYTTALTAAQVSSHYDAGR